MEGTRLSDLKAVDAFAGPTPAYAPSKRPFFQAQLSQNWEWALPVHQGLGLKGIVGGRV